VENLDHVRVARNYPSMQEGIPVHRVIGAKLMVERIRVGENLRTEKMVQAERRVRRSRRRIALWAGHDR
jgi:hypothetical protein